MTPLHSRHRQLGRRSVVKRVCQWVEWIHLVWFGSGHACGKDSWREGFLFAHPRTIHRDRKGWWWESIEPVVDMDRGGSCLCAWAIDLSGLWDHAAYVSAWECFGQCRCNTYPSRARARWG